MSDMIVRSPVELISLLERNNYRALLIGATVGGRNLYCELEARGMLHHIAFWTDEKSAFYKLCGLPVRDYAEIKGCCDVIIIGGSRAEKFAAKLLASIGMDTLPIYRVDQEQVGTRDFVWHNIKYTDLPVNEDELIEIDPRLLLREDRIDLAVRYLAAMEILNGTAGQGLDIYLNHLLCVNGFEEHVKPFTTCAYFSDYREKKGAQTFIQSFKKLLNSMEKNGFNKQHFIPVTEDMKVLNGAHRLIAALIYDKNVWIKKYRGFGDPFVVVRVEELRKMGCTPQQIKLVEETYQQLVQTTHQ